MAEHLTVQVVSPERLLYSGEATMVVTRTIGVGEIAFQAGHVPFLGALTDNHTRIYLTNGEVQGMAIHGGFVEVSENRVSILSDAAELSEEIDVQRAQRAKERAEERLRQEHDIEALAALSRAHARLIASGNSPY